MIQTKEKIQPQLPAKTGLSWPNVNWIIEDIEKSVGKSEKKAEKYLEDFAKFCIDYAVASGIGTAENLGAGVQIHISDTIGRKRVTNNKSGNHAIGICYPKSWSEGQARVIEVDRTLKDTLRVLDVVAHEVCHAVLPETTGHYGKFVTLTKKVFKLGGIPTATLPTPAFLMLIKGWLENNGTYPHVAYNDHSQKQTTRMIKLACNNSFCAGSTDASKKQDLGTIFRMSSVIVLNNSELQRDESGEVLQKDVSIYDKNGEIKGDYKYIDYYKTSITCPVCQGPSSVWSQLPVNHDTGATYLYQ